MNWIISESEKLGYHTKIKTLFEPLYAEIDNYNWLLTQLEYQLMNYLEMDDVVSKKIDWPIDNDQDYFLLSPKQLKIVVGLESQFIWGVFSAIPIDTKININEDKLPLANEDNIWKNANIQHPDAQIEIVCFDSTYTIVKFKDKALSDKFKAYFGNEAVELEKFS